MSKNSLTRISFRVKDAERMRIIADAKIAGLTVGSYVRSRLLDCPQTAAMYRRSQFQRTAKQLIGQIGRIGNNMNQIATRMNSGQYVSSLDRERHEEAVAALIDMRAMLIKQLLQPQGC